LDRSQELFERIKSQGVSAIDEFIETRTSEELFLDFKRSSDNGSSSRLSQIDRNNLAKAISGFGNSEGGVIVWGVDCSADHDGADVAKSKVPIQNIHRFLGHLQGAVSGCTIPPHGKVEHYAINSGDDCGFVATLIPKSDYAPHQMVGKLQYFIRAGSDFVPTPHQVLAGMFGKRPQPNVFNMFTMNPAKHEAEKIIFEYGILVTNKGPGIAENLYFSCLIYEAFGDNSQVSWEFSDRVNWSGNFSFGRQISVISNVGVRLPPDSHLQPLLLRFEIEPPFTLPLSIKGSVGCGEAPSYKLEIDTSINLIEEIYNEYFRLKQNNELDTEKKHELASRLLNMDANKSA
jgi:hypothetical protein